RFFSWRTERNQGIMRGSRSVIPLEHLHIMLHTQFMPLTIRIWANTALVALLLAAVAYAPSARAADPPLSVDDLRGAFNKDLDRIKALSEALSGDQSLKVEKQREIDSALAAD